MKLTSYYTAYSKPLADFIETIDHLSPLGGSEIIAFIDGSGQPLKNCLAIYSNNIKPHLDNPVEVTPGVLIDKILSYKPKPKFKIAGHEVIFHSDKISIGCENFSFIELKKIKRLIDLPLYQHFQVYTDYNPALEEYIKSVNKQYWGEGEDKNYFYHGGYETGICGSVSNPNFIKVSSGEFIDKLNPVVKPQQHVRDTGEVVRVDTKITFGRYEVSFEKFNKLMAEVS
jgi:hypothetical protein